MMSSQHYQYRFRHSGGPKPAADQRKDIRKEIYDRSMYLYYVFLLVGLVIVCRMLYIQYSSEGFSLREEARNGRSFGIRNTEAKRGDILSHDNRMLATTIPLYHIYMDFAAEGLDDDAFRAGVDSLSIYLSGFFKDRTAAAYRDSLSRWRTGRHRYKRITPRRINYIELKEVVGFPILRRGRNRGGMVIDTVQQRIFPNGDMARRTIGRMNAKGGFGLESFFDKELSGVDGVTAVQKISGNFWMPIPNPNNITPIDGHDIVSTIDIEVQEVAEAALREQLEKHDAIWGTAILMEVSTGQIRAIANLNKQVRSNGSVRYIEDYNYGVGMNMEPGSTFKLVSLMALLDDAKAGIGEMFDTGDGVAYLTPHKIKVSDTHRGGYGNISLKRVFEVSSNIGFAKAINKYYGHNPKRFTDYLYKLGLHKGYDLQLPGEATPVIRRPGDKQWDGSTLTMMSFGYAMLMTPIHTLAIYNAIANDGCYVKPLLVTEIRNSDGVVRRFDTEAINERICSPGTLRFLQESLEGVVNDGTAKVLRNDNYRVAGKTGTAQVAKGGKGYLVDGGRYYLGSMVGYFPADKPKYSCIVAIETFHPIGSTKVYYGGSLSGPVFRAIADKVYSQSPDWGNSVSRPARVSADALRKEQQASSRAHTSPQIKGGRKGRVIDASSKIGVRVKGNMSGEFVRSDSLHVMRPVHTDGVPDARGMALRDAVVLLEQNGLVVAPIGTGIVTEQRIKGDTVYLRLR